MATSRILSRCLPLLLLLGACGGTKTVDGTTRPEAGIVREVIRVDGFVPPANPTTGGTTPTAFDQTQVVRYRADVDPPAPCRAVVIAYPGFLGGAGSFDGLARAVVRASLGDAAPVEVWAIDRRANLLEDLVGEDAAEAASDPDRALRYYFQGGAESGHTFVGFHDQAEVDYMSEWGLSTHAEDLRRVIALVPQAERRGRVVLLGHSLGAAFAEAYAAYRFADGTDGIDELAGLVLVDGVLDPAPLDEPSYRGGVTSPLGPMAGLDTIRASQRFQTLPFFGVELYAHIEALSLRALLAPAEVVADAARDDFLRLALALGPDELPRLTNRAVVGFGFDAAFDPFSFARATLGAPDGALRRYTSSLTGEVLSQPSDRSATYDWHDADSDGAITRIAELAHAFVDGRTNFAEWYFPARLGLDLSAVGGARVAADSWQAREGLTVLDGDRIDAPILCISAGLVGVSELQVVASRVAPAIGAGRPDAGVLRTDPRAFQIVRAEGQAHLDPILANLGPRNPVPAAVSAFIATATTTGAIAIPRIAPVP